MRLDHLLSKEKRFLEIQKSNPKVSSREKSLFGFEDTIKSILKSILKTEYIEYKKKLREVTTNLSESFNKSGKKTTTNNSFYIQKVKLIRAYGECLGIGSRRRTWLTAKSCGEL